MVDIKTFTQGLKECLFFKRGKYEQIFIFTTMITSDFCHFFLIFIYNKWRTPVKYTSTQYIYLRHQKYNKVNKQEKAFEQDYEEQIMELNYFTKLWC